MNPHTRRRQILNLVRLPIPPLPHVGSIVSGIAANLIIGPSAQLGETSADYLVTISSGCRSRPAERRDPRPPLDTSTIMKSAAPTRTIMVPEGTSA